MGERLSSLGLGGLPGAVLEERARRCGGRWSTCTWGFRPPERRGPGAGRADPGPVPERPELPGPGRVSCWPSCWRAGRRSTGAAERRRADGDAPAGDALPSCCAGTTGSHLLIEVQARYRYFLMPVLFLLAGAGAQAWWGWWKSRRVAEEIPGKSTAAPKPRKSPLT